MIYIDTSVLVAYYCPEPLSEKAEAFLTKYIQPAISILTELELFSALSRKVREKGINHKDASRIIAKFIAHLGNNYFNYLLVETHHFRLARSWMEMFKLNLRTLDSLHLAITASYGFSIVTLDKRLSQSAKALGIKATLLG